MRIRTFVVLENDEVTCNQRIVMHACDQKQIVIKTYLNSVPNYISTISCAKIIKYHQKIDKLLEKCKSGLINMCILYVHVYA